MWYFYCFKLTRLLAVLGRSDLALALLQYICIRNSFFETSGSPIHDTCSVFNDLLIIFVITTAVDRRDYTFIPFFGVLKKAEYIYFVLETRSGISCCCSSRVTAYIYTSYLLMFNELVETALDLNLKII